MINHGGELAALLTAFCWVATSMSFEAAGKRIGSLTVNFIRLIMAFTMMGFYLFIRTGAPLPLDADGRVWLFMGLSGFIGFALGDLFLFQAFVLVGARISMLVYASVPIITGLAGFFFLHETLGLKDISGMLLTVTGIAIVVLDRNKGKGPKNSCFLKGVFFAALGAAGQAGGLILSKFGMAGYNNPFGSNMIRIIAGIAGFAVIISVTRRWLIVKEAFRDGRGMLFTASGAFFGPFVGVSFSLIAITLTSAGVASTIMAITPVLIIIPAVLIYKEQVNFIEIAGAVLAVTGVALLFL